MERSIHFWQKCCGESIVGQQKQCAEWERSFVGLHYYWYLKIEIGGADNVAILEIMVRHIIKAMKLDEERLREERS